jgi:predicted O-methyltransferase YrrM
MNTHLTASGGLDIVQRLLSDKPSFHLSGEAHWDALPETLRAIARLAKDGDSTIETGAGASTVVFAASGARHTAISPDPSEHQRVRDYCRQAGVDDSRITFCAGLSDDVLPSLLGRDRTLDVAFIDGAHSFPLPAIDWYYITRALKTGGTVLVDDVPIPAVAQVFRHMSLEPNWRLQEILDNRTAAFTLLAPPPPEDWTNQLVNRPYPDFSFASLPKRASLTAAYRMAQLRSRASRRYPTLRRIYKRMA